MPEGSPPGALNRCDWRKIVKGAGIALAGSGLAYVGSNVVPVLPDVGMGWLAPIVAVCINVALKGLSDTRNSP